LRSSLNVQICEKEELNQSLSRYLAWDNLSRLFLPSHYAVYEKLVAKQKRIGRLTVVRMRLCSCWERCLTWCAKSYLAVCGRIDPFGPNEILWLLSFCGPRQIWFQ
jgi:hypothetical protein